MDFHNIDKKYKILLVPGHCVMDEASAGTIRRFVEEGGTVIMTAYSAKVDEHNRVFSTTMPGRLSDVFGIRANAFENTAYHYSDSNEGGLQKQKLNIQRETPKIKINDNILEYLVDYYELLEPATAEVLATLTNLEQELPAVSINTYGKGKAVYVAVPAELELMQELLNHFYVQLGVQKGPETPLGVSARQVGDHVIYVNTTADEQHISLAIPRESLLTGHVYETSLKLAPYGVEVVM